MSKNLSRKAIRTAEKQSRKNNPMMRKAVQALWSDENGERYFDEEMAKYIDSRALAMSKDMISSSLIPEASRLLAEAECHIAVINVMIMLVAIERVVGNLKTVQRNYQRILDEGYEAGIEYVSEFGVRAVYEEFRARYGIEIEFDDIDINDLHDEQKYIAFLREALKSGRKGNSNLIQ